MTIAAFVMLIFVRYPDPDMYRNSVAFISIVSFFLVFYFSMGRGWYQDVVRFLDFDPDLQRYMGSMSPTGKATNAELVLAAFCTFVNVQTNNTIDLAYSQVMTASIVSFYFIQWTLIVFCADIITRQLVCLFAIAKNIKIDLLNSEFYSSLANVMVRHVGLYIFGVCIISMTYIVFTEGELSASEMMVLMMPWYLPGLIIISLYLIPYNIFMKRIRLSKLQELNSFAAALSGNIEALQHSLLKDEGVTSKIDLLYYQDRIRALILFGILPPLT